MKQQLTCLALLLGLFSAQTSSAKAYDCRQNAIHETEGAYETFRPFYLKAYPTSARYIRHRSGLVFVSDGAWNNRRQTITVVRKVDNDGKPEYQQVGDTFKTYIEQPYLCFSFSPSGKSLRIRSYFDDDGAPWDEVKDISGYLPETIEAMKKGLAASTTLAEFTRFIERYEPLTVLAKSKAILAEAKQRQHALNVELYQREFASASEQYSVVALHNYLTAYPNSSEKIAAVNLTFKLVEQQQNLAGYQWFIDHYPQASQARTALKAIHSLAFEDAQDIDSIEAYNDFIVTYPLSSQREQADSLAYELEEDEYSNFFTSDEKLARALSIRAKKIKRLANETNNDDYLLVVARMTRLLEDKFPAEKPTERHLENEEIVSVLRNVSSQLRNINRAVNKIADNTADLSSILSSQSNMMNAHFSEAAQDRDMAAKYTESHRFWERYMEK
ncbi:hypothetical protein A9Q78_11300 [Methylophaga sp. 41_12_T18]|nr:hypothetical protein A9Q78_11300 [Methylophaga sp. 41_12_T18]